MPDAPLCPKCGRVLSGALKRLATGVQPLEPNDYSPRNLVILKHRGCGQQVYTSEQIAKGLETAYHNSQTV